MQKRTVKAFFLFALLMGTLMVELAILSQNTFSENAVMRRQKSLVLHKSRGYIYDCNFNPLVNEERNLVAVFRPSEDTLLELTSVATPDQKHKIYEKLSKGELAVSPATQPFSSDSIKTIQVLKRYGSENLATHVVGYVDGDGNGVSGIEKYYDSLLKHYSGRLTATCSANAFGNVLAGAPLQFQQYGYNSRGGIALTLDKRIQEIAETALRECDIAKGAVVILDAKTAEVRAMASVPTFDRNQVEQSLEKEDAPFLNRAITPFAVGSVFKPIVAAAALEQGIKTDFSFSCVGMYALNANNQFSCHKHEGHGTLNMYGAMAQSCNPYFIHLALHTGKEPILQMASCLGLGEKIELADDWYTQSGILPRQDELQSEADLCNLAFGQGTLLASPLQMAGVYAAIVNDGVYRAPSLVQSIVDANGEEMQRAELPASRRVMQEKTAKTLQSLLRETVVNGSARRAEPKNSTAAGKTATAQSGSYKENGEEIIHAWFCGYFPSDAPKYVVTILKEDGEGGSKDCIPVFRKIADELCLQNE